MSELVRSEPAHDAWSFSRAAMTALGKATAFRDAAPWPHAVIDGLLGDERSAAIAEAFPRAGWKKRDYAEQARLTQVKIDDTAIEIRHLLAQLCSAPFVDFLNALTGRRDLIADPQFTGAGPMATERGGHLALHSDFNRDSHRHLARVISILYYVPRRWDPSWGGELELWDRARTRRCVSIAPLRDRLVILAYGEDHWHGHPSPLACPDDEVRAVVGAIYYAATPTDGSDAHGARW